MSPIAFMCDTCDNSIPQLATLDGESGIICEACDTIIPLSEFVTCPECASNADRLKAAVELEARWRELTSLYTQNVEGLA